MSGEKKAVEQACVFDKIEVLRNQISMHIGEIEAMVELSEESAMAESEGRKNGVEWLSVFAIIGHIQKMAQEKINELDVILSEQRVIDHGRLHLNAK